jgi:chaperonin GroEL
VEGMQYIYHHILLQLPEKMNVELENPYILLLYDKKYLPLKELLLFWNQQSGKPLIEVAEDADGEALSILLNNKLRGAL